MNDGHGLKVLLATDGSASAEIAVDLVSGIAWPPRTVAQVAQVVERGPALFGGPWPNLALAQASELEAELRRDADRTLGAAARRLADPNVLIEPVVLEGRPATEIVDGARRLGADMVVMGSRGHGALESMLLGSVSEEVANRCAAPVLIARRASIHRILLAWDGSPPAARAASLLQAWPIFGRSTIRVVTVVSVPMPLLIGISELQAPASMEIYLQAVDTSRAAAREVEQAMVGTLVAGGLAADGEVLEGDPAREIVAAAAAWNADLIVIGSHGRSGLARLILGSVARNVIRHAHCSVLVARVTETAATQAPEDSRA